LPDAAERHVKLRLAYALSQVLEVHGGLAGSEFENKVNLFLSLFFGIAPGVLVLLSWRAIARARIEDGHRKAIIAVMFAAICLWLLISDFILEIVFDTVWALAHTRPLPSGYFPEGWSVYGWLVAYSGLGAILVWTVNRVPPKQATQ
jgi:hypothetical protein